MRRREFLIAGILAPGAALAQARAVRVGMLGPRALADSIVQPTVLRGLAELGYRDGAGMVLAYRSTDGIPARAAGLARELIDLKCDVIFAFTEDAIRALRDARSPTPVVFFAVDFEPLEKGIVNSLRRPGGSMTGVYLPVAALTAKKLEIAQEVLPDSRRFLVISDLHSKDQLQALRKAADARGVQLTVVEFAQQPYDLAGAFETGRRAGVEAFIGLSSPVFGGKRADLGALFASYRMPAFVGRLSMIEPGFLVAYTIDLSKAGRRAAAIGARILKGAKPGDIPVEQADEFELVVNLKTARALGVKIPYSVLARATRVIE